MEEIILSPLRILVPIFPERQAFGPLPVEDIAVSLFVATLICSSAGYFLTRSSPLLLVRLLQRSVPTLALRDEVWEEPLPGKEAQPAHEAAEEGSTEKRKSPRKRTGPELLFIVVHNSVVATLALLAWVMGAPSLALHAFCLEVSYEIFDSFSLGFQRMEPETLIHHLVSPICVLCSTQTDVDFRVLCQLCICIDASGAILGMCKFLLRFSHLSASNIYKRLSLVYLVLRVILPVIDTVIIVWRELSVKGGFFTRMQLATANTSPFARTDWMQLYFWSMAVMNAFNAYFYLVVRARARLPAQVVANWEARS
ncbi:unnamed protein product [Symbiodinium natans]|uniref:TLC domain-containing protein n=1 Tax=Symbiodinium natans TaxID=878477 RepID=A0A812RNW4_9DINO|nr:unnamed protein product [Symbiodinium natans]